MRSTTTHPDQHTDGPQRYRIGPFVFDTHSGELTRVDVDQSAQHRDAPTRLSPKPARLLALLIERRGELLSHEEIRDELWPDVLVEFDQSVHFCVRQVRSALGDAASRPRYIETLPRRGYRLLVPAEPLDEDLPSMPSEAAPRAFETARGAGVRGFQRGRTLRAMMLAASCVVALAFALAFTGAAGLAASNTQQVRLAIMPFEPPSAEYGPTMPEAALHIVARLGNDDRFAVIGPSTTSRFASADASLADIAAELEVGYIINGRFLPRDGTPSMLAELIRTSDGAHIWVRLFASDEPPEVVADLIAEATRQTLTTTDTSEGR